MQVINNAIKPRKFSECIESEIFIFNEEPYIKIKPVKAKSETAKNATVKKKNAVKLKTGEIICIDDNTPVIQCITHLTITSYK